MKLSSVTVADFANDIAQAFGLKDGKDVLLSFEPPASSKAISALYMRLGLALDARRPAKHAPSLGAMIAALVWSLPKTKLPHARLWPPMPPKAIARYGERGHALAELTELVAQGAFERTKRAERSRLLAEIILLFGLESLLEVDLDSLADDGNAKAPAARSPTPLVDVEEALRVVQRALRTRER